VSDGRAFAAGLSALIAAIVVAWGVAAGVNVYYDAHPVYFIVAAIAFAVACLLGAAALRAADVSSRRALIVAPLVALTCIGAGFAFAWWNFPKPGPAAHENREVLRTLPVYAGARFSNEDTWGRYAADYAEEGFVNPPSEWLTTWTWRLPRDANPRAVADWYVEHLRARKWHVERNNVGNGTVFLTAERRGAWIGLDVLAPGDNSVGGPPRTVVEVDATTGGSGP
jgi:hypothetical protein